MTHSTVCSMTYKFFWLTSHFFGHLAWMDENADARCDSAGRWLCNFYFHLRHFTDTHPFNDPLSGTIRVNLCQKGWPSCRPTNSVKALTVLHYITLTTLDHIGAAGELVRLSWQLVWVRRHRSWLTVNWNWRLWRLVSRSFGSSRTSWSPWIHTPAMNSAISSCSWPVSISSSLARAPCIGVVIITCLYCLHRWLGSRVVSVVDSGTEGPGFKSQLWCCRVTVLGKLFTLVVPLFTKQRNW